MPRDHRLYMTHVCFYVCCSDCVMVCGSVCWLKRSTFLSKTNSYVYFPQFYLQSAGLGGQAIQSHDGTMVETMAPAKDCRITIRFNADISSSMQWNFKPQQTEITVSNVLLFSFTNHEISHIAVLARCVERQTKSRTNGWCCIFQSHLRQNIFLKINMSIIYQGYNLAGLNWWP